MSKLIAVYVTLILSLSNAYAQVGGCYVDVSQPGQCWNYSFSCYVNQADNLYFYGSAVGGLCNNIDDLEREVAYQQGVMNQAGVALQGQINRANAAEYDRDVALAVNAYQASLIKKLKKKCGKACKKIK